MTTNKTNTNENKKQSHLGIGMVFISIIFFIRAGYYFFVYLGLKDLYYGEWAHQSFSALFLLIAFFFLASGIGLLYRKKFAYYLAWLLILPDILLSGLYAAYPAYAVGGIILTILTIAILLGNKNSIKPRNKTDTKATIAICIILLAYIVFTTWTLQQPKLGEYQAIITAEAIQKNDITICDKLVINRIYCQMDFAVSTLNTTICDSFELQQDVDQCKGQIHESVMNTQYSNIVENIDHFNVSICQDLDSDWRDKCFKEFANHYHVLEWCNNITQDYIRIDCNG